MLRQMCEEVGLPWRNSATGAPLLPEHGLECDGLEAFERLGIAVDLHAQDRALPGREQEVGKLIGLEIGGDLAARLRILDAGGERDTPFGEDRRETCAQQLAAAGCLEAEIADQAAATIAVGLEPSGDDVEVAPQARARRQRGVLERLSDEAAGDVEVAIEHLGSKHLLGAEMVGEGPLRCARRSGDVAHAGAVIAGLEHDLEAGVEDGVFERGLGHERTIRTYVLKSSAVLSLRQSACQSVG
jgi:hypothetical protein